MVKVHTNLFPIVFQIRKELRLKLKNPFLSRFELNESKLGAFFEFRL